MFHIYCYILPHEFAPSRSASLCDVSTLTAAAEGSEKESTSIQRVRDPYSYLNSVRYSAEEVIRCITPLTSPSSYIPCER